MRRSTTRLWGRMALTILSVLALGVSAAEQYPGSLEVLPAEYELMQGVLVGWLPMGPVPDRPITELSNEEIATLNRQSMSEEHTQGHTWKPAYGQARADKIKLKKGAGSPDTDGLGIDIYPYHYMMLDLVKAIISSGATAHIVVNDVGFREDLKEFMWVCGFKQHDFNKIVFHLYGLNSIWMRDYGPWVTRSHNRLAVIDDAYYPLRPADDLFPGYFAETFELPKTDFNQVYTEGGNILTDGLGRGFATEAVLASNPGLGIDEAKALFEDVLNLNELIFLPGSIPGDFDEMLAALGGTLHVDMGLKLLSETKVMIGDFLPGSPGKELLDSWAEWFNTHTNPDGEPYEVYRVFGATNGFDAFSYANSVVINRTVIVPQFGDADGDSAAIAAYENAMPDYKTIGVRSELLPLLAGGLHCITKEIPLGILKAADDGDSFGPGADVEDRVNHDDLVWVNDGIGAIALYASYPDVTKTAPAVMAATLGLSVGKDNPDNYIVPWPDLSNAEYLNPYNNMPLYGYLSFDFLLERPTHDWILRNALLFPDAPKSAIEQAGYMNSEISVVSIGTSDLAAWNGVGNTPPEIFTQVVDGILLELGSVDPGKKIVLTTPLDYGAIFIAIARYYGQEPSPADVDEDYYATLYADIIKARVAYANSQGMNVAVADFTGLYKSVATGTVVGGIPLHIGTLPLLVDQTTGRFTDLSSALHAYVVIDAINQHYGVSLPLPDLASY